MTNSIINLHSHEFAAICGGVTEGPDGKGCTDHDGPGDLGGPVDLGPAGPTIEIDASI